MTMSLDRPASARHIAAAPRLTPSAPTPVEVALRARIAELEAEQAALRSENSDLKRDNSDLKRDNSDLKSENCDLKSDNERLLATNTAVWRKIAEQDRKLDAIQR